MKPRVLSIPALIVICSCIVGGISYGTRSGMGLYLQPVSLEYGWGRSVFSMTLAIQLLALGVLAPFAGAAADKWGAAKVVAIGGAVYSVGLVALSYIKVPALMYASSAILIGTGFACTSFAVLFSVVGNAVSVERRSIALGLVTATGSFGQFAILPLTQWLISRFDWHFALLSMAGVVALTIPLSAALSRPNVSVSIVVGKTQSIREALLEAWGERSFHLIFWGFAVCGFQLTLLTVHLPAFVMDSGLRAEHGMMALALIGLFNIIGSIAAGWLGGRLSKKYLLAGLYLLRAGLLVALIVIPLTPAVLYVFAAGMGLLWLGTMALTSGLIGQIFGVRYLAMLGSVILFGHQLGSFAGAVLGGYLYDATGTYVGALAVAVGLSLVAMVLNLPVNESPISRREVKPDWAL